MKILVTLDGSSLSESILDTVITLVGPLDADVELFRVARAETLPRPAVRNPVYAGAPDVTAGATIGSVRLPAMKAPDMHAPPFETVHQTEERIETELRNYLQGRARALRGQISARVTVRAEIDDDPAAAIIRRAREEHVDFIAMATHGRTGLSHLLAGSVCEQVIRSGVAPVMVLRP
jgi:nucleotide-binding universal stress UspA family protein